MGFDSVEANRVLAYVKEKYGTEPEFLWARTPNNAILRHKGSSKKWYAALLKISKQKLGLSGEGDVHILDLKCDPVLAWNLIDKKSYFLGYHMNKGHWITIILDGSVEDEGIFALIDMSYDLTMS